MLVLTRKVNESVVIIVPPSAKEQRITVTLKTRYEVVRLAFDAAAEVKILRTELVKTKAGEVEP